MICAACSTDESVNGGAKSGQWRRKSRPLRLDRETQESSYALFCDLQNHPSAYDGPENPFFPVFGDLGLRQDDLTRS